MDVEDMFEWPAAKGIIKVSIEFHGVKRSVTLAMLEIGDRSQPNVL